MHVAVSFVDYQRDQAAMDPPAAQQQTAGPTHRTMSSFAQSAYDHADQDPSPFLAPSGRASPELSRTSVETSSSEPSGDEDSRLAFLLQQEEVASSSMQPEELARVGAVQPPEQQGQTPDLCEDPELAQRFQRRLSDVKYGKHTPRVNSIDLTANPENFLTDRELLMHRLALFQLSELSVKGDGNCQFRALADQLYRTAHQHRTVRRLVCEQLSNFPEYYAEYVHDSFDAYRHSMQLDGTWGDHVTLQALSDALGIRIVVLTSFAGSAFVEILPHDGSLRAPRSLYVSFWAEVHYNSLYPTDAMPVEVPKSKVLGSRKLHRLFHRSPQPA